jgi:IclR family acetate operon transcriptional repressor
MEGQDRNPLGKALKVLRHLLESGNGYYGVRDLARSLNLPTTTVHRALAALEAEGLVQREPETGRYQLGLEFYRLAWRAQAQYPVRDIAMRYLPEIVSKTGETGFLGLYDSQRMEMFFAAGIDSDNPVRYVVPLHQWFPVYASASGLAVMAFLPEEERQRIVKRTKLAPLTANTVTDAGVLEAELAEIRAQGYACTHGRRITGASSVAVPIFLPGRIVTGDLVLTIPEQRFEPAHEASLARLLQKYAKGISEQIGH